MYNKILLDFLKVIDSIRSCQNTGQLNSCKKLTQLFLQKWKISSKDLSLRKIKIEINKKNQKLKI